MISRRMVGACIPDIPSTISLEKSLHPKPQFMISTLVPSLLPAWAIALQGNDTVSQNVQISFPA